MTSITRSTVHLPFTVADMTCQIEAQVEDSINLQTGDSVCLCTITSIINSADGQMVAPATLTAAEFRQIVRAVQNKHSL